MVHKLLPKRRDLLAQLLILSEHFHSRIQPVKSPRKIPLSRHPISLRDGSVAHK